MISTCRRKQYVEVVATHYIDGGVRPQKIVLATGQVTTWRTAGRLPKARHPPPGRWPAGTW